MDGGRPPGLQQGTLFYLPKLAVIPKFMMNFGGIDPFLAIFCQFLDNPPIFMENLPKEDPCLENIGQKPTHMGGTFPYPQHVMYPLPSPEKCCRFVDECSLIIMCLASNVKQSYKGNGNHPDLRLGNDAIASKNEHKHPGLILDSKLDL